MLPSGRALPPGAAIDAPHGTTIVTLTYAGGVVMAGDRRATMGNLIANRDMEKVFAPMSTAWSASRALPAWPSSWCACSRSSSSTTRRSREP